MHRFPHFKPLATQLRFGGPVERQLAVFEEQAKAYPERFSQLAAIRFYLHDILWRCQHAWNSFHRGNTNYLSFIDAVVHPVVVRDTLHQSKVDLAMNVYDKASAEDIRAGLRVVSKKLLGSDLLPKDLLPATPKQGESDESAA